MTDPLQTLLRLRRLAVDQARRGLADCLREEAEASERTREIEAEIERETETVCRSAGDDGMVEAYAAWLRRARVQQNAAAGALLAKETHTQEARAVLAAGRAAVETVEAMIERKEAEQAAEEDRQEQKALDEIGTLRSSGRP